MQFHYVVGYDTDRKRWFLESDTTAYFSDGNLWDDEQYRQAWARVDAGGRAPAPYAEGPQPAYPGGPIDGDLPQD